MKYKSPGLIKNLASEMSTLVNILTLCCLCLLIGACQNQINHDARLPNNFYKVSDDLFRSQQPTTKEMQYLNQLGFKTVINLRRWHSDQPEIVGTQLTELAIKMRAGKIEDDKVISILKAIQRSPKPILIHCWHGSDRTGVIVAMYRLVFQNWSKAQAIDELMEPEFGHHYNVYPNIVKYIENVDVEKIRTAVMN